MWSFHSTLREDIKLSQALQTNQGWVCSARSSNSIFTLLGSGLSLKASTMANENCETNFHGTLSKPAAPWKGADGSFLGTEFTQTTLSTGNCWTTSFSIHGALSWAIQSVSAQEILQLQQVTLKSPIYCSAVTNQRHYCLNQPHNKQVSCKQWWFLSTPSARLHQRLPAAICCSESLGLLISGAHLSQTVRERSEVVEGHKDAFETAKENKNAFVLSSCHCFFCHPPPTQVFVMPARER